MIDMIDLFQWLLFVLISLFILFIYLLFYIQTKDLKKFINIAVTPNFINISNETDKIIDIVIANWKLRKRIMSLRDKFKDEEYEKINNAMEYIFNSFKKLDIDINDREGDKYNDGMNIEVKMREGDPNQKNEYIKETLNPEVLIKGNIVKKEKVILMYEK